MRTSILVSALGAASAVVAQDSSASSSMSSSASGTMSSTASSTMAAGRPSDSPICDYYAKAIFGAANATTEYALLTALVNTAVIGADASNSSNPLAMNVTGIVNPGYVNNTADGDHSDTLISLLKYFNGSLASTNRGNKAVSVNFLDGGGAVPLTMNMPANATLKDSNQYVLFTHLYEYFGALLGCSGYGMGDFPAYGGAASMYQVHKFMDLSYLEIAYFIQEVAYAALWFGVAPEDLAIVGSTLGMTFNNKCGAPAAVVPANVTTTQSFCLGEGCKEAPKANCSAYDDGKEAVAPSPSNSSNVYTAKPSATGTSGGSGSSGSGSGSSSSTSSSSAGAAAATVISNFGPVLGFAGLAAIAIGM